MVCCVVCCVLISVCLVYCVSFDVCCSLVVVARRVGCGVCYVLCVV